MTFNWGTGITIFFIFFAASMTFAVVATTKHPPQLMQKDYYALDLNYQERLESKQNTAALSSSPLVQYDAATKAILVNFPNGMVAQQGTVKCYRSSTTQEDFSTPIENTAALSVPAAKLTAGRWHVELDWTTADGKKYFWTTPVIITNI